MSSACMISNVERSFNSPSWWMPDSWAKAFLPTIALFACTMCPVKLETMRLLRAISVVTMLTGR